MAFINCKISLINDVTGKEIWSNFFFDTNEVFCFRPYVDDNDVEQENETVLFFKSGKDVVVNMNYLEVYHRVQAIPYSYN